VTHAVGVPTAEPPVTANRWELFRALGAIVDTPEAARVASPALGLPAPSAADHTSVFVLNLPPYASVYLGPDGALGGEGTDRVAGFWRVLGISPPTEPDHLAALLGLYASLGEAVTTARKPAVISALSTAQATLFWEHLHSWLPGYLHAVGDLPASGLTSWAGLLQAVIDAESRVQPPSPALPLALREAPPGIDPQADPQDLAGLLTIPVRAGMILTRHCLALGAGQASVGHRMGERRFTLRAMLEQDPPATLDWLAGEARRWARCHDSRRDGSETARWWAARARRTAQVLHEQTASAASTGAMTP